MLVNVSATFHSLYVCKMKMGWHLDSEGKTQTKRKKVDEKSNEKYKIEERKKGSDK